MSPAPGPGTVHLVCRAAPGADPAAAEALCAALAGELAAGTRRVIRAAAAPVDPGPDAAVVRLEVTRADPAEVGARLVWIRGAAAGASPPLALSAMDTTATGARLRPLAVELLRQANFAR